VPTPGGAIIQSQGIIRVLCMLGYEPSILYIRSPAALEWGATKRKADPLVLGGGVRGRIGLTV
jgi:hypothetical protein